MSSKYKFDNGVEHTIHPLPSYLYELVKGQVEKELVLSKPMPPIEKVRTDIDVFTDELNPNDPAYKEALSAWENEIDTKTGELYFEKACLLCIEFSEDEAKAGLAVTAEKFKKAGLDLPVTGGDCKDYVNLSLLASAATQNNFWAFLLAIGTPQEEIIKAFQKSFRG